MPLHTCCGSTYSCELAKKERSLEKRPKCKNEQHYSVLATFWGLGGSGWRLLGSILGDLRHKLGSLGRSWRQVGNFLATCWEKVGRRWPKMTNLSGKRERPMRRMVAAGPRATTGRLHWKQLVELENWNWQDWTLDLSARLTATRGRRILAAAAVATAAHDHHDHPHDHHPS